jgi:hypothetical protein
MTTQHYQVFTRISCLDVVAILALRGTLDLSSGYLIGEQYSSSNLNLNRSTILILQTTEYPDHIYTNIYVWI